MRAYDIGLSPVLDSSAREGAFFRYCSITRKQIKFDVTASRHRSEIGQPSTWSAHGRTRRECVTVVTRDVLARFGPGCRWGAYARYPSHKARIMIQLTRLRQAGSFYINPDFIERIEPHVDTVVRLVTGAEYVVEETAEEIVRRIVAYRCSILLSMPEVYQHSAEALLGAIAATSTTGGAIALESSGS